MSGSAILDELWNVISDRATKTPDNSYTAKILTHRKGIDKSLEKVGEEATEYIIAVKNGNHDAITSEAADLLFHFLISLKAAGVEVSQVYRELEERRKP